VLPILHCYLQPDPSNGIRLAIDQYARENGLSYYNIKNHEGLLRTLVIRTSNTGEVMVIVQFGEEAQADEARPVMENLLTFVQNTFPEITSLQYVINPKKNDTFSDLEVHLYAGRPYIVEKMEDLSFRIGPKSFFQTNSQQAYTLYKTARDFAQLTGIETVYDLYTGTGTIANFIAKKAKKVIGIEYVPEAIEDAQVNAKINGITNTKFFAGDIKETLQRNFVAQQGRPDVIITDPPRSGMHPDVVKAMLNIAPQKIVYVSCNPATQARDIALLNEKYRIEEVQPVDMFPHTHHVENVVLLRLLDAGY
jgi:23S rRNA (uracil1939-C5)-methyltransferase